MIWHPVLDSGYTDLLAVPHPGQAHIFFIYGSLYLQSSFPCYLCGLLSFPSGSPQMSSVWPSLTTLNWAFSILAPLTFWAGSFFVTGCCFVHDGILSSIPGLYLLDAHSTPLSSYDNQQCLQVLTSVPWGAKLGTLRKKNPTSNLLLYSPLLSYTSFLHTCTDIHVYAYIVTGFSLK